MSKILRFGKQPILIISAVVIISGIFVYFNYFKKSIPQTVAARRGTIIQEVMVTGKTKPAESVDLSFEKSGRVNRVNVKVGEKILAGQSLIELDSSELLAQLNQNEASLQVQKAKLEELNRGVRPEEIQIKQAEFKKAQQDLANDYAGTPDVLNDAYAKADDAIRTKTDALFTNDDAVNPTLTFTISDSQLEINLKNYRVISGEKLTGWKTELQNISKDSSPETLDQAIKNAKSSLSVFRSFLNYAADGMEKTIGLSSATLDTYRTNINTARNSVNIAFTSVSNEEQAISAQKLTVSKIQDELNLKLAGSTSEEIKAQEAQVRQAEATVQLTQAQLSKTILRSPINGKVTKQEAKVGEIAPANTLLVSVISENKLEIEANIPEVDIAKVAVDNPAKITLDAYGNDVVFEAKVASIDPAETIIEGVATYKTKFHFIKEDKRIKPGMTANIDIIATERENVIIIPKRAVISKDGGKFIQVLNDKNRIEEVEIETGLRSSDGNIEIIKGINEGDKVIIFLLEK